MQCRFRFIKNSPEDPVAPSDWLSSLHVGVTRKQHINFSEVQKEVTEDSTGQLLKKAQKSY